MNLRAPSGSFFHVWRHCVDSNREVEFRQANAPVARLQEFAPSACARGMERCGATRESPPVHHESSSSFRELFSFREPLMLATGEIPRFARNDIAVPPPYHGATPVILSGAAEGGGVEGSRATRPWRHPCHPERSRRRRRSRRISSDPAKAAAEEIPRLAQNDIAVPPPYHDAPTAITRYVLAVFA